MSVSAAAFHDEEPIVVKQNPQVGDAYFTSYMYPSRSQSMNSQSSSKRPRCEEEPQPYLDYIKSLSEQWPRLKYLAEFMEAGTAPERATRHAPEETLERKKRFKVGAVDFTNPSNISCTHCTQPSDLDPFFAHMDRSHIPEDGWSRQQPPTPDSPLPRKKTRSNEWPEKEGQSSFAHPSPTPTSFSDGSDSSDGSDNAPRRNLLLVVEDLSSTVIEKLGAALDIDPTFFRAHLEDHTWFNITNDWVEMPEMESRLSGREWTSVRYVEPRFYESSESMKRSCEFLHQSNVVRRLDLEGQVRSGLSAWWEPSPHQVGLVRRKMSVWGRSDPVSGWVGVVLVDPPIQEGFPLWNGYGSLYQPPSMRAIAQQRTTQDRLHNSSPTSASLYARLIDSLTLLPIPKRDQDLFAADPEAITMRAHDLVFGEMLVALQYTHTGLFQCEWLLDVERLPRTEAMSSALETLQKWQRRLMFFNAWAKDAVAAIEGKYNLTQTTVNPFSIRQLHEQQNLQQEQKQQPMLTNISPAEARTWQSGLRMDYVSVLRRMEGMEQRAERVMRMAEVVLMDDDGEEGEDEDEDDEEGDGAAGGNSMGVGDINLDDDDEDRDE